MRRRRRNHRHSPLPSLPRPPLPHSLSLPPCRITRRDALSTHCHRRNAGRYVYVCGIWDVGKGKCARTGAHVEFRSRRSSVVPRAVRWCGVWRPACRVGMLCYENEHGKKRYGEERMVSRGFGDTGIGWPWMAQVAADRPADRPDRPGRLGRSGRPGRPGRFG